MPNETAIVPAGELADHAVAELREILARGVSVAEFAHVDPLSGAIRDDEARALMCQLPPLPASRVLVTMGVWQRGPSGQAFLSSTPRYPVGRKVLIRTSVQADSAGRFDPKGALQYTHRAALLEDAHGETVRVSVDGAPRALVCDRRGLLAWNQPSDLSGGLDGFGVRHTPDAPLWRAHLWAAAIELAPFFEAVDFAADASDVEAAQAAALKALAGRVTMTFAGRGSGYAGPRTDALLDRGQGTSFTQAAVLAAFLEPFAERIGVDVQLVVGRSLRQDIPRAFLVVTSRPHFGRFVMDPAWSEPLTALEVAFEGPVWGQDRQVIAMPLPPSPIAGEADAAITGAA